MLERSKTALSEASADERRLAEIIALRVLASELEENLLPADKAAETAREHRDAADETWRRAVHSVLQGLRSAAEQGYKLQA